MTSGPLRRQLFFLYACLLRRLSSCRSPESTADKPALAFLKFSTSVFALSPSIVGDAVVFHVKDAPIAVSDGSH